MADAGDLTRVVGVGEQIATRLRAAGIDSVRRLAGATVEQVVAACGPGLASRARAASWIEQAAALATQPGHNGAGRPSPTARRPARGARARRPAPPERAGARSATRRTFTVEVRLDSDTSQPVTTHVRHVESQAADGWPGWDPARLVEFVEHRIGVLAGTARGAEDEPTADAEPEAAQPEAPPAAQPEAPPAGQPEVPAEVPLVVHRFGLLKAGTPLMRRGEATARLQLDPADLDLPEQGSAVAQIELLAQPLGTGREQVLDTLEIDLSRTHGVDAQLHGPLPDRDPPFALSAIVRVLVGQPTGPPRAELGGAVLDVVAGNGAG